MQLRVHKLTISAEDLNMKTLIVNYHGTAHLLGMTCKHRDTSYIFRKGNLTSFSLTLLSYDYFYRFFGASVISPFF
jgi:hypothetical protein